MPAIKTKNSISTGVTPSSLNQGELAVNITDSKMWVGNAATTPVLIVNTVAAQQSSNVTITGGTIDSTTITASATSFTSLTRSNAVTVINSSVAATSTDLPTQAAVKAYSDAYDGTLKNIYQFRSNGTYTKSGTDVRTVKVICVGGGGGGRGYHESGGGGGYAEGIYDISAQAAGHTVAVTVGTGTGGGVYFGVSGNGTTSSFGAYISATGGYGANANKAHCGGHGGIGQGGQINMYGGGGGGHAPGNQNLGNGQAGEGGATFFGGSSAVAHAGSSAGLQTLGAPGGGGPSGAGSAHTGQTGCNGIVVVYEFK
jgi:hypothetical protein